MVALDDAIHAELQVEVDATPQRRIVNASYAAWLFAQRKLYERTVGPRNARGSQATVSALRAITRELNYVDTHPALQGVGMLGTHTDVFPVWRIEPEPVTNSAMYAPAPKLYSPYPQPHHDFVVLVPAYKNKGPNPLFTYWVPRPSAPGRLSDEHVHLLLWRWPVR